MKGNKAEGRNLIDDILASQKQRLFQSDRVQVRKGMCKSVKDSSKPRGIKQHKYNVEVEERRLRYILIVDLDTKESECGGG
jgi:hypothetical protein